MNAFGTALFHFACATFGIFVDEWYSQLIEVCMILKFYISMIPLGVEGSEYVILMDLAQPLYIGRYPAAV